MFKTNYEYDDVEPLNNNYCLNLYIFDYIYDFFYSE